MVLFICRFRDKGGRTGDGIPARQMFQSIMRDAKLIFDNSGNLTSGEYVTREGIRISLKFSALKELPRLQEQFFSGSDFSGKDWIVTEAD